MYSLGKKVLICVLMLMMVSTALFAAGGTQRPASGTTHNLTFATVIGSPYYFPVYVAREKGWLRDAGLNLREISFTNGPVMVEGLSSWDIGISGVGGQLPGVITHNAVLLAPINTDDGTQRLFVRNNSPILAAGTGHNSLDPRIYGTAATWRGQRVICNTGAVLHYFLIRVLEGFNLTTNDIQFLAMDVATAGSAFRAGEGDVVAMTGTGGTMTMLADPNFTAVAAGPWVVTGLIGAAYANRTSLADSHRREAMKMFFKVYYDTLDWIYNSANFQESISMMVDYSDESGIPMDREMAEFYLQIDRFFTMREGVDMMTTMAPGKNYSVMEDLIVNVLNFFIDTGSRQRGDVERFVGNIDPSLLSEVLRETGR